MFLFGHRQRLIIYFFSSQDIIGSSVFTYILDHLGIFFGEDMQKNIHKCCK